MHFIFWGIFGLLLLRMGFDLTKGITGDANACTEDERSDVQSQVTRTGFGRSSRDEGFSFWCYKSLLLHFAPTEVSYEVEV